MVHLDEALSEFRKPIFNSATKTLPDQFGNKYPSRKRMKDLMGLPSNRTRDAHLSPGHDGSLLRACKDIGIEDVQILFMVCPEDWCNDGRLS
jgi:hypothetical protein